MREDKKNIIHTFELKEDSEKEENKEQQPAAKSSQELSNDEKINKLIISHLQVLKKKYENKKLDKIKAIKI